MERTLDGYQLTERGKKLVTLIRPFGEWSREWAKEVFHFNGYNEKNKKE